MSRKRLSRNDPCPCGSGKKYKHCCYGKGVEDDLGLGSGRQQPQYPIGTVAMYGPDDKTTTKIAAGVILHDGAEAIMQRRVATDVTTNPKGNPGELRLTGAVEVFEVRSVLLSDRPGSSRSAGRCRGRC